MHGKEEQYKDRNRSYIEFDLEIIYIERRSRAVLHFLFDSLAPSAHTAGSRQAGKCPL